MRVEELAPELLAAHCDLDIPAQQQEDLLVALQEYLLTHWDHVEGQQAQDLRPATQRLVLLELLQDLDLEAGALVELTARLALMLRMTQALATAAASVGLEQPSSLLDLGGGRVIGHVIRAAGIDGE